jgi:hypothetical protein
MNDPHVVAVLFRVDHADSSDYDNAPPLEHDKPDFSIRIEKGQARVLMKAHHATVESARAVVDPFLRAWELSAALFDPSDNFEFVLQHPEIIDRRPNPGVSSAVGVAMAGKMTVSIQSHTTHGKYPDAPVNLAHNADVESILHAYRTCCAGLRNLSDASYFGLTVLERAAGGRNDAAEMFGIDPAILNMIGKLTAQKGGKEARKSSGTHAEFTLAERTWLQAALKILVRRVAEVAHDSSANRNRISMSDLPPI